MQLDIPARRHLSKPREWSVRTSVLLSVAVLVGLTAVIGGVGSHAIASLRNTVRDDLSQAMQKLDCADQITTRMADMRNSFRGLLLFSMVKRTNRVEENRALFQKSVASIEVLSAKLSSMARVDRERAAIQTIASSVREWATLFEQGVQLCAEGKYDDADNFGNDHMRPVILASQKAADDLAAVQREAAEAASAEAASLAAHGMTGMAISGLFCLAALGWVLRFLNHVTGHLRHSAETVTAGAQQVASAAREIESSSQSLAQGASEQAASLEETSASSHQISASARHGADRGRAAVVVAAESNARHTSTAELVNSMTASMQRIKESSNKVASILKIIDQIAFQTNILALNAAVEAARAGEAGQGFAVVADEVRNLAQQCAKAAGDTAALIDQSVSLSNEGDATSAAVAKAIGVLMEDAGRIRSLLEEIRATSDEQERGTQHIADAIQQLEQATQRVAAQSEEAAAASHQLSAQSVSLQDVAAKLASMAGV